MGGPELSRHDVPAAHGLVLMLHGGKEHSFQPVARRTASWRRTNWMLRSIRDPVHRAGVGIWLLSYTFRGWNIAADSLPSPVPDAQWALDEVRAAYGDLPVVILGHSMGARTGVAVADDPNVAGVVALAPWLPADEPVGTLRGKHLAAAHGRADKITSFGQTRRFVERAAQVAASTEFVDRGRVGHYMLRDIAGWNRFALSRSLGLLSR